MKKYRFILLAAIILTGVFAANAQNEMSPYSKYGYGMLSDNASGAQRAMGGVGYAMNNGRQINVMNPASYAMCDSLTFLWDIGLDLTNLWSKEGDTRGHSFGGGLDYITMQFPISKRIGGSAGLVPYSSVGYSFGSSLKNGSEAREGMGGINQLYIGAAYQIFDGFSFGFNASYNFGNMVNDTYVYTSGGNTTLYERVIQVRDWGIQLGAQYSKTFNKRHRATIGVTYTPSKSFHGDTWGAYYMTTDSKADTVGYSKLRDNFTSPHSVGLGLNYTYNEMLTVEADFTYQNWSKAKFKDIELFEETKFNDRYKAALGLQYVPKIRGNYAQRINYRIGANYTRDYMTVRGNNVREYGIAVGFGLPSNFTKTMINLGFEYRHRESSPVNYISENYFNITIGVNFNEMWFWKNKLR